MSKESRWNEKEGNEGIHSEVKERLKPKTHDLYLTLVFSSLEQIVILSPHFSNDPRAMPSKFVQQHLVEPSLYFDRVMSFDMTTFEYTCNGEQISDDIVGVSNTFLSYLSELKAKDASFTYIEMYQNGERITNMADKRSLFTHTTKLLQKSAKGEPSDLFKKEGNVVYARDIIEYLVENVVRPNQEPARYREQLKKMWEQLVMSSLVHIRTEKGTRVTNGICVRMEDATDTKMEVQLFLYLETPDIIMSPEVILQELNSYDNLSQAYPEMTTLVCSTSNDYEFSNLILNGLFNIPIWKCYGKVLHNWTYEEGIPHRTDGLSVVRENLFADSGLTGMDLTNTWDTIENKFIQYHFYLFTCLEHGKSDILKYVDYNSLVRNDGTPQEKILVDLPSDKQPTHEDESQLLQPSSEVENDTTPLDWSQYEGKIFISPHRDLLRSPTAPNVSSSVRDGFHWEERNGILPKEFVASLPQEAVYTLYSTAETELRRHKKIQSLLVMFAKIGMSESFYREIVMLETMSETQIDAVTRVVDLMRQHSTRSDSMLTMLKALTK